jgi:hypothetical protein
MYHPWKDCRGHHRLDGFVRSMVTFIQILFANEFMLDLIEATKAAAPSIQLFD